jgi:hypothetical protein
MIAPILESGAPESAAQLINEAESRFVSIVDDDIDITELFQEALCKTFMEFQ